MTLPSGITANDVTPGPSVFGRVLGWLTAGYPEGIPPQDRFAVVALLKRRLTDEQVHEIVAELTLAERPSGPDGVITDVEIEQLTERVLSEQPSPSDLARVSARLAAAGWPLEGEHLPDEADPS
ncbi:hypothetical protein FHX74_003149 [Friedmanniella endophytica]|uniref:DUF3349 domain-containing protein n=1 Tax=Microlunatus kandeliicorticis TaxID=1759536 RepID=A0A7W3IUI3_9ACTN|nr:DUF3349 domain-containing protein [Microlunatus kandeliicorticis]MBA8795513.1 hypothetical protein [Microlunatus kandeliicorticis]